MNRNARRMMDMMIADHLRGNDNARGKYNVSGEYDRRNGDYHNGNDYSDGYDRGYDSGYEDGRRGVKYTGRYGIGGRDHAMYGYDSRDYRDGGGMMLTADDMEKWKRNLKNADGTRGGKFDKEQIKQAADRIGAKYSDYDEHDLCMAANMLYSDYSDALRSVIPPDREVLEYTKMARAFLEDKDASSRGKEKLSIYYKCIVEDDDADERRY